MEVEIKDDTKDNSYEAVGMATYSNSESTVWTHASIFETLWIQAELENEQEISQKMLNSIQQRTIATAAMGPKL